MWLEGVRVVKTKYLMEIILILENQIIIMESLLCNPNNDNQTNKKLREQIIFTKAKIRALS